MTRQAKQAAPGRAQRPRTAQGGPHPLRALVVRLQRAAESSWQRRLDYPAGSGMAGYQRGVTSGLNQAAAEIEAMLREDES